MPHAELNFFTLRCDIRDLKTKRPQAKRPKGLAGNRFGGGGGVWLAALATLMQGAYALVNIENPTD